MRWIYNLSCSGSSKAHLPLQLPLKTQTLWCLNAVGTLEWLLTKFNDWLNSLPQDKQCPES